MKILKNQQPKSEHHLCEEHLSNGRRQAALINCLIYMLGIERTDGLLSGFSTSLSGLLFGLQPHLPELFANEALLKTLYERLSLNYGIDADLLRGLPLAYDCDFEKLVVDGQPIMRATDIRKALTLELIFKSDSGGSTPKSHKRNENTALRMWDHYRSIK